MQNLRIKNLNVFFDVTNTIFIHAIYIFNYLMNSIFHLLLHLVFKTMICNLIFLYHSENNMVNVAQLVRASDCGSEGRGFEPHLSP